MVVTVDEIVHPVSRAELLSSYGWLLTVAQVMVIVGILLFGAVKTYMDYRYFSTHIEESIGTSIVWIRCVFYLITAIVAAVGLQLLKP